MINEPVEGFIILWNEVTKALPGASEPSDNEQTEAFERGLHKG
jgi:hypothetical protein